MRAYWTDTHNLAEGAGAAPLAARCRKGAAAARASFSPAAISISTCFNAGSRDPPHERRLSPSPYSSPIGKHNAESHTLSVLVDNEPGVLARVVGLFSARSFNIESLTVAEVAHETHLSRITIATSGTPEVIEQVRHQLERLVPVHSVTDLSLAARAIERELAMVKVRGKGDARVEGAATRRSIPRQGDRRDHRELHFRDHRRPAQDRRLRRSDAPDRACGSVSHRGRGDLARAGADLSRLADPHQGEHPRRRQLPTLEQCAAGWAASQSPTAA